MCPCGWHGPRVHWNGSTYCPRKWWHSPYPCWPPHPLDHIRMGMAAGHLPRPQRSTILAFGATGLVGAAHPCTHALGLFSAFFLLLSPLLLAKAPKHCLWDQGDVRPAFPATAVLVNGWPRDAPIGCPDTCRALSFSAVQHLFRAGVRRSGHN